MLFGKVPGYDHLRVFGCLVYAHDNKRKDKFSQRGSPCIFIGYPYEQKAYRVFDLQKHSVYTSRDVTFFEEIFPFKNVNSQEMEFGAMVDHACQIILNQCPIRTHHGPSNYYPPITKMRKSRCVHSRLHTGVHSIKSPPTLFLTISPHPPSKLTRPTPLLLPCALLFPVTPQKKTATHSLFFSIHPYPSPSSSPFVRRS
ncbi:unnamed protein product [Cuscuta epithymum]|uniref:Retroviral polymerase SH3-like domain-containing protein n=1 Tax=Cuscuta epithymum TaxID=186058 RepID=A0AAV0EA86_9ASTE|nr:unnamed protein product [Cuscuta epithymum]